MCEGGSLPRPGRRGRELLRAEGSSRRARQVSPVRHRGCLPSPRLLPWRENSGGLDTPSAGRPADPGSSAQCGLPAWTRGAPQPCCALGPEGGGGPGARDGRQRRGAPGSPSAWIYPRTPEIAMPPDARVAPSPGVPRPPLRQTRPRPLPRPLWVEGGRERRSLGRIITPVPNIPHSGSFRPGRKPGWGGCAGPAVGNGCRPFWGEPEPLCHLPCTRLQVPDAESRAAQGCTAPQ